METRMNVFQSCSDTTDVVPLSASQSLFLKPVARLNISVQLPSLKQPGKSISNWEVMEKLRYYAAPEEFTSLKVSKSTLEVVRFEGEIENRSKLKSVLARLDGRSIKLSGFPDSLKVRAAEAKPGLSKHSWDSYFRDAKNMNEMKPGERPDTVHITNLPCRWFATKSDDSKPSEYILRKVFEMFGEIRCVDIPTLDPFRSQMKPHISGIKMFSNNQNMIFEAYIQFKEYICFVKTMDTLRNMKLLHIDSDGKAFSANIKVDFDKTKHLSDSNIRRRRFEREKLMSKEREREEKERQAREEVERKHAEERKRLEAEKAAKLERQQQREERRKAKQLARLKHSEADEMNKKIATEERLLLMAQRRLESFRLLGELFNRLKTAKQKEREKSRGETSNRKQRDRDKNTLPELSDRMDMKEKELREKLVKKFKHSEQSNQRDERRDNSELTEHQNEETYDQDYNDYDNNFDESRNFQQFGHFRGGWRGRLNRRRRGNMPFRGNPSYRGNQYPAMPFHQFHNRKPFFNQKDPQWSHFPTRNRGRGGFIPPPFIDPYLLEAAVNDPYYKYFQKLARRRSSRSRSRSYSRSRSRSYSRSRSRSYSRSSSSRSRHRSSRSRSRSRRHRRSRSRSKSRSRRKSKDRKRTRSNSESRSSKDKSKDKEKEQESVPDEKQDQVESSGAKCSEKAPSVHTWSRSPSRPRSLSWEKRKDEPSSSSKKSESSSKKKKKKHKKDKKKKKLDTD